MTDDLLIDLYLRDRLSKEKESLFVMRIRKEPLLKEKVLVKVLLIRAIHNVGRRRDEKVVQSVKNKLTWKRYILIYGMYSNYYFTNNMSRYHSIFNHESNASLL